MPNYLPGGISLKCYKPNGQLRFDYSQEPDLKLVTTDEINCGYSDASFELCNYFNKLPLFGDKIVVKDESLGQVTWVGEPADITKDVGVKATIKCLGYGKTGALDLPYAHGNVVIPANPDNVSNPAGSKQVYNAGTSYNTIIQDTLTRTQNIFLGDIVDLTSIQIPEDSRNYIGLAPAQIWNELSVLTGILATPLMWFVRGDAHGGDLPSLYMRYMGGVARLFTTWDNKLVKVLNDSYERDSYINGCTVAYGSGLQYNWPDDVPQVRDHTLLPTNHDRDKFVNADNNIISTQQAQALGEAYVARFGGPLASSNCTIEICGGRVRSVPPVTPVINDNLPFWFLVSGLFIRVFNMPSGDAPYNNDVKFIVRAQIDYTAGKATLTCGVLQNPGTSLSIMQTYLTSRPYQATNSGQPSEPYVDQDTTARLGPPSSGASPALSGPPTQNLEGTAIPNTIKNTTLENLDANKVLQLKWDAGIDPRVIPDYGIMGNYENDGAEGIKGFIQVIPGRITAWNLDVLPSSNDLTVPNESITVELYTEYPPVNLMDTVSITTAPGNSGTFSLSSIVTKYTFAQGGRIGIKVTVGMSDVSRGFHLTLRGPKAYPDLNVTPHS